ncbi:hypothetical protein AWM79_05445 [Pseudomonas agarici]|uniref:Uncharacterized protein n=1 Tax=Pseudomonas agarici TaxID=46677 RepID=A0A0X1SY69_PSEAA|nr:hypothetical protein [Pseudomonas agarici]AMB84782.1 hypothetical protein AWM79_05445 [Pseudomonas agarici]NWC09945.1 hypothetical protein [Pseudomonas agarici]SEL56199.1 hypothetical protein SAMN05216604_12251 [Pseudomonas agarici]
MNLRNRTFTAPLLTAGCLVAALSGSLALASDDALQPPKPTCTDQQVWNPQTNQCDPRVTSTTPDQGRADHAYNLVKDKPYQQALNGLNRAVADHQITQRQPV